MWINQPSTLQPYHNLHGKNVLCDYDWDYYAPTVGNIWQIYFTEGCTHSMRIEGNALSNGWKK